MKMAVADAADLEAAANVSRALEAIREGFMPSAIDGSELGTRFNWESGVDSKKVVEYLVEQVEKASLFRVTFGMQVLLAPENAVVDPASDVLELHPTLLRLPEGVTRERALLCIKAASGASDEHLQQDGIAKLREVRDQLLCVLAELGSTHPTVLAIRSAIAEASASAVIPDLEHRIGPALGSPSSTP